jgi:HK97 gp10 family phage protein
METGFKFEYDKQIFNKIKDVMQKASLDAVKFASQLTVTEAHRLVPVDTGRLKNSITDAVFVDRENNPIGMIGTNVEYAPYVEFGTRRMRAQPYLYPAVNKYQQKLVGYLKANISKIKIIK